MTDHSNKTFGEAKRELDAICNIISDKGYHSPRAQIEFKALDVRPWVSFFGEIPDAYRVGTDFESGYVSGGTYCDDVFEGLETIRHKALDLPAPEDTKRAAALRKLAQITDELREAGFDEEFINPLTDLSKRLSENAITYQAAE